MSHMRTGLLSMLLLGFSVPASAHFILRKPVSMYVQTEGAFGGGDPQKSAPCGPASGSSPQASDMVTEVEAGSMLNVTWDITVPHAGYFRIALDKDPTKFTEPPYTDPVACTIDLSTVPKTAHDNVLMDGIDPSSAGIMVKVPDEPCDDCTLQVIQAMKDHGPPNCTYYHCAKIKIVPKGGAAGSGATAGTGAGEAGGSAGTDAAAAGSGAAGTGVGAAGSGAAGSGASAAGTDGGGAAGSGGVAGAVGSTAGIGAAAGSAAKEDSGCSASGGASTHGSTAALVLLAIGWVAARARRRGRVLG